MTIAVSLKVDEGLVLAADSASSLMGQTPDGQPAVINVYNNANKIFNVVKGLPLGAITWGMGSIGNNSIAALIKDLRQRLTTSQDGFHPNDFEVRDVAERVKRFIFDEHYEPTFREWPAKPDLGFIVAGYSTGKMFAEEYQFTMVNGQFTEPQLLREERVGGVTWNGLIEPITRLLLGFSTQFPDYLKNFLGLNDQQMANLMPALATQFNPGLVQDGMPLQDAIDLAHFLVDTCIQFSRFAPGAPMVGGQIELASINRHEGFIWISRKHYYQPELNPDRFQSSIA